MFTIEGIWSGQKTPDLNNQNRFLRGGNENEVLTIQEDSLQDHYHFHTDYGHNHGYTDTHFNNASGDGYLGPNHYQNEYYVDAFNWPYDAITLGATTGISVTGATGARIDTETRPKNMFVIYLMKVC